MILMPMPRVRERRYTLLMLAQGCKATTEMEERITMAGIGLVNCKAVRQFISKRFGINLSRSRYLNYPRLHEGRFCTACVSSPARPISKRMPNWGVSGR